MSRTPFVCGNWKMNPATVDAAAALARAIRGAAHAEVAVAPPAIALSHVSDVLRGTGVAVYAQDAHWAEKGAYTGQLAVSMLEGFAVGSIVGHSEVRRDQGDTDERVAAKLARVLGAGLRAVLCVGESEAQFASGETDAVVTRQIALGLASAPPESLSRLIVAYEPIWAIGTGRPATAAHATLAAAAIRRSLAQAGADADTTRVLYGGSVTGGGVAEFSGASGIDGALVGGASLDPAQFATIVGAFDRSR